MEFNTKDYVILIPAYKPVYDEMVPFVRELLKSYDKIVCVDDGGGREYSDVFSACKRLGCRVLTHTKNKGKGAALRKGLRFIHNDMPDAAGVITADCDGQHAVKDILKVTQALYENPDKLIIGGRRFDNNVPARSKIGNTFTRVVYKLATGISVYDTQTGLRGFPMTLLPELIKLPGDRYEYEMNMLLRLRDWGVKPYEVTIATIYHNENKGSHFNPLKDGLRIISMILKYAAGSIISFLVDWIMCLIFMKLVFPGLDDSLRLPLSYGLARVISSTVNYIFNRLAVFGGKNYARGATVKYFGLVIVVLLLGMLVQRLTAYIPGGDAVHLLIKLVYDTVMFFVNYIIQRDFVFKIKKRKTN
ncbi:MAG: bifunctional glycosyltransferase family 2/GtrA family protein [Clostridia bacterium]|nr:bifunctional glycosyltransferase family 2/GtrA family protein [Clostridia bacterium]